MSNNLLPHYGLNGASQQGLNGLFGRFLRGLIQACAGIADGILGSYSGGAINQVVSFSAMANAIGEGGSSFWQRTDGNATDDTDPRGLYEPTSSEAAILNEFSNSFGQILADITINSNGLVTAVDNYNKVNIANLILRRINVIQWYYKNYELQGLSTQAIALRSYSIEILTQPILTMVDQEIGGYATLDVPAVATMWSKMFFDDLQPVKQFQVMTPDVQVYFTVYQLGTREIPVMVEQPVRDTVIIPKPEITIPVQTVIPQPTTATNVATCPKSNDWWKWLLGGLAAGMVINK